MSSGLRDVSLIEFKKFQGEVHRFFYREDMTIFLVYFSAFSRLFRQFYGLLLMKTEQISVTL